MKKHAVFTIAVLALLLMMLAVAGSQEEMEFVDNSDFANPQRTPSVFRHEEHNEIAELEDCAECHHVYDDNGQKLEDETSEDQRCSECHESRSSGRKPSLTRAYHLNCKGCHLKQKKGPFLCGECHAWQ